MENGFLLSFPNPTSRPASFSSLLSPMGSPRRRPLPDSTSHLCRSRGEKKRRTVRWRCDCGGGQENELRSFCRSLSVFETWGCGSYLNESIHNNLPAQQYRHTQLIVYRDAPSYSALLVVFSFDSAPALSISLPPLLPLFCFSDGLIHKDKVEKDVK